MARLIPMTVGVVLLIVAVIIIIDLVTEPTGTNCIMDANIILPDRCFVPGCEGDDFCPPATTRPYMIFWTEAATCPDGNFLCPISID